MTIPEFCSLFSDVGDITAEVKFKIFDGTVRSFQMHADEITKLIDPNTGQFYSEMNFDDWRFFVYKIEIDPIRNKMIIRAISDLSLLKGNASKRVKWDQVSLIFERFCVWNEHPEMDWFKEGWKALEKSGLTSYKNADEKQIVLSRAVVLAIIYNEFTQISFGEDFNFEEQMKILFEDHKAAGFDFYQLWGIVGREFNPDLETPDSFAEVMFEVIKKVRKHVSECLKRNFGGDESLTISLWYSRIPNIGKVSEDDVPEQELEKIYSSRGYEYICNGMSGIDW